MIIYFLSHGLKTFPSSSAAPPGGCTLSTVGKWLLAVAPQGEGKTAEKSTLTHETPPYLDIYFDI